LLDSVAGPPAASRQSRGFALLEMLVAVALLVVAVLGYAATVMASHRLNGSLEERSTALVTLQRFVERLRADDDWVGLYGRLAPRSAESALDVSLSSLAADPALPSYPPAAYYPDFTVPPALGTRCIFIDVLYVRVEPGSKA